MRIFLKKCLASLLAVLLVVTMLPVTGVKVEAAPFGWTEESFNYGSATPLNTTGPEKGWSTGWKADMERTKDLDETYFVSDNASYEKLSKGTMYRGLNTPVQLGIDKDYYISWTMQVDEPVHPSAGRSRLTLSGNTFFGMSVVDGSLKFVGRFLGQHVNTSKEYILGKEYRLVLKISSSANGANEVGLKIYDGNTALEQEPTEWDIKWDNIQSKLILDTIGLEADLYQDLGKFAFDEIKLSSRWDDIAGTSEFGAREDFAYPEGTLLSNSTADGGWSSGWKASSNLNDELTSDYVVTAQSTVRKSSQMEMYRGMVVPINTSKDKNYYVKWNFAIEADDNVAGKALLKFDDSNYIGVEAEENSTGYQWVAHLLGQEQQGPSINIGEVYTAVMKLEAHEDEDEDDRAFIKVYAAGANMDEEPTDWDMQLDGKSNEKFENISFDVDLSGSQNSYYTLYNVYVGETWEKIAEERKYYMEDWFDLGAGSSLNESIAMEGWMSGWKSDDQLQNSLPDTVKITGMRNVALEHEESMYRGIMPMSMIKSQDYYMSWKMAANEVDFSADSLQGAHVYLDSTHYFGFRPMENEAGKLEFFTSIDGAEQSGPEIQPNEMYTIVAKFTSNVEGEKDLLIKVYPENRSAGIEPQTWDITEGITSVPVFESIGFQSLLGEGSQLVIDEIILGSLWEDVNNSEEKIVGKNFFEKYIDLTSDTFTEINNYIAQDDYAAALYAYRDYFVDKISQYDLGKEKPGFGARGTAEQAMNGYITTYVPPDDRMVHYIGEPGLVKWYVVSPDDLNFSGSLAEMDFTLLLSDAFLENGDNKYMVRWNNYWDDFTRHNYLQWNEAIASPDRDKFMPLNNTWRSKLRLANRNDMFLQQLNKVAQKKAEQLKQTLSPVTLALTLGLLSDMHLDVLDDMQSKPGGVPNQNAQVGVSMLRASFVMDDFKRADQWRLRADEVIGNYVDEDIGTLMKDGSDLEQSFNYNGTLIILTAELRDLYEIMGLERDVSFLERRLRFLASLMRPTGNMPALAKMDNRPFFEQLDKFQKVVGDNTTQRIIDNIAWGPDDRPELNPNREPLPAFTSIYFPYGGFTVMRSGWDRNAHHLFMKSSRRGTGHADESGNQIQVTAFGKSILIDAGSDSYNNSDEMKPYDDYFISSFAHNTIAINNKTQLSMKTTGVNHGYSDPIDARWLTSSHFDFTEGIYSDGYADNINAVKADLEGKDVNHGRQVIFVKELGAYIVTDRVNWTNVSGGNNQYTQIWNFDPSYGQEDIQFTENSIYTSAPEGPNIELHHFSDAHRSATDSKQMYSQYYDTILPNGQARGYYRFKTTEEHEPKVDVHVDWEAAGDQLLVTLINPFNTNSALDRVEIDPWADEDNRIEGFNAKKSQSNIYYRTARNLDEELTVGKISVQGEALLVTRKGNIWQGVVLGATSWTVNEEEVDLPAANFEFLFYENDPNLQNIKVKRFGVPETFEWTEMDGGLAPSYFATTDPDLVIPSTRPGGSSNAPIEEIEDANSEFTVQLKNLIKDSSNNYSVQIGDAIESVILTPTIAQEFAGASLTLRMNDQTVTLPAGMLEQLTKLAAEDEQNKGNIVIGTKRLSEQEMSNWAPVNGGAGSLVIRPAAHGIIISFSYVTESGKEYSLDQFEEPVTFSFQMANNIDGQLVGIYYEDRDGKLVYIGGEVEGQLITAAINESGIFAALEWKQHFADMAGHWAERVIQIMAAKQIVNGVSATEFAPERQITRAEYASLIVRSLGLETSGEASFTDVPKDAWYADSITAAYISGIIKGKNESSFGPEQYITREEMAVMLIRAYQHATGEELLPTASTITSEISDWSSIAAWAQEAVAKSYELQLLRGQGNGQFNGQAFLTRAEAVQTIANMLER